MDDPGASQGEGQRMKSVINLRQARKRRERDEKRAKGDAKAAQFGRSKAQKAEAGAAQARNTRHLDGHKRDE